MERARAAPLAWGDDQHQSVIQSRYASFDTIIGADVVYASEVIPALFRTCKSLLSPHKDAQLVLCHITRRVSENAIIDAAAACGLQHTSCLPEWTETATASVNGPFRLLIFKHKS